MTEQSTRKQGRWGLVSTPVAAISVIALYVWDDVLLAGPIIALAGLTEPWIAFVTFATVYSLGSYVLAILGVRAYDRWSRGEPSRLARWLSRQQEHRRAGWARRLLDSSKVLGFFVASFALGAVVTTFFIRYGGRREGIRQIAAASSVIFGMAFTALYTGIAAAIFGI